MSLKQNLRSRNFPPSSPRGDECSDNLFRDLGTSLASLSSHPAKSCLQSLSKISYCTLMSFSCQSLAVLTLQRKAKSEPSSLVARMGKMMSFNTTCTADCLCPSPPCRKLSWRLLRPGEPSPSHPIQSPALGQKCARPSTLLKL